MELHLGHKQVFLIIRPRPKYNASHCHRMVLYIVLWSLSRIPLLSLSLKLNSFVIPRLPHLNIAGNVKSQTLQ